MGVARRRTPTRAWTRPTLSPNLTSDQPKLVPLNSPNPNRKLQKKTKPLSTPKSQTPTLSRVLDSQSPVFLPPVNPFFSHRRFQSLSLKCVYELDAVVKQLGKNKTPGLDGLTSEFFLSFWSLFKSDLLEVLNSSIHSNTLPASFHKAVKLSSPKRAIFLTFPTGALYLC